MKYCLLLVLALVGCGGGGGDPPLQDHESATNGVPDRGVSAPVRPPREQAL